MRRYGGALRSAAVRLSSDSGGQLVGGDELLASSSTYSGPQHALSLFALRQEDYEGTGGNVQIKG